MRRPLCAVAALLLCAAAARAAGPAQASGQAESCAVPEAAASNGDETSTLLTRADAARRRIGSGDEAGVEAELDALLEAAKKLAEPPARARLRIHVARSLAELGRTRRAADVLLRAAGDAKGRDERLASYATGYLAELYERAGRREEATALARRALFAAQRAGAPDATYRWHWLIGRLRLSAGDRDGALEAHRAAIATLRGVRELGGPDVEPVYLGLVDLLLREAAAAGGDAEQALLQEARAALEDLKAGELRDYFRDPCLDAQRKAAPDRVPGALVVYPVPLPDRLELIAGREGRLSRHAVEVTRKRFGETARELRHLVTKRTTREYLRPASKLYDWLIRPLDLEDVETVVLVPGGATRVLPLAALYDARRGEHLIEKRPVAITPGLTLMEPRPLHGGEVKVLAAGVSEAVQGYPALPGVRSELEALHDLFDARRMLDETFATDRFRTAVRERVFDIVHVASHGEFRGEGSESFLLTHDGRMPMDQLGDLVGATRFRERGLELLTLSACRTATGDERAALGLAGVALRAGARSALATLWAVNDEVSSELMAEFYVGLSREGLSRAAALQRAQLMVLRRRAYRHPVYWAPFLLISSWL